MIDALSGVLVWLDGEWRPAGAGLVSPVDRCYLYGDGVFETFRSRSGHFFRLERHLERMRKGLELLGIEFVPEEEGIRAAAAGAFDLLGCRDVVFRLTVSRGTGWRGLRMEGSPQMTILATPCESSSRQPPLTACLTSITRDETSPLSTVKTCNYLASVLALLEAQRRGCREAVIVSRAGWVSECSSSNLFWVDGGELYTPSVRCGALPGVMRSAVLDAAVREGIPAIEGEFLPRALAEAEYAFVTSSVRGLHPLGEFEGKPFAPEDASGVAPRLLAAVECLIREESC
ncbi:MAG: branched chain amino acid aminotransferase [Armatimonadota bacterium]|nr:MAG: branched chain amino acid aminotransferase [Armatimonadota bacterium]